LFDIAADIADQAARPGAQEFDIFVPPVGATPQPADASINWRGAQHRVALRNQTVSIQT